MKTIKFSDEELELMTQIYQDELAEALAYVAQIQDVLKKLGAPDADAGQEPDEKPSKKKKAAKISEKEVKTEEPKKRGRKPKNETTASEEVIEDLPVVFEAKIPKVKKEKAKKDSKAKKEKKNKVRLDKKKDETSGFPAKFDDLSIPELM